MSIESLRQRTADFLAEHDPNAMETLKFLKAAGVYDVPVATSVAQAFAGDLAVTLGDEAVQLHGGIGMTWEHPAHFYLMATVV